MYSGKECEEDEQHQGHKVRDLRVKLFVIIFFTNTLTIKSAEMLMNAIAFSKQNVHACIDILFFIAVLFWGSVEYCSRKWSGNKGIFKETQGMSNRRSVLINLMMNVKHFFLVKPLLVNGEKNTQLFNFFYEMLWMRMKLWFTVTCLNRMFPFLQRFMASSGFWFPNSSTEPYYPALWREWLALYWHTTGWVSWNSGTTLSEVNQYTIKKGDGFTRF